MIFTSKQIGWIERLAPFVQTECVKRGYHFASPILAQASTESFKGDYISKLASDYNNFFGLKCGSTWTGKSVNLATKEEYSQGVLTDTRANWRVYDDTASGVKGYFDFINTKRYANLKNATSPQDYLEKIKADGFATSSSYVETNLQRMEDLNLKRFDNFSHVAQTGNPYDEPVATLKKGNKGNGVRWIQYQLNVKGGYRLIVDGIFGVLTDGAVRDFQKNAGITVDGLVGPVTRMKLLG